MSNNNLGHGEPWPSARTSLKDGCGVRLSQPNPNPAFVNLGNWTVHMTDGSWQLHVRVDGWFLTDPIADL